MKSRPLFIIIFCFALQAHVVAPRVSSRIHFADMRLHISRGAKARIQEKVDSLTRNKKSFQALLDQVNLFLPIVERILKEEGIPTDFKYLVIQESGLIPDAVSTANAVGFWQFRKEAAMETGLKMNRHVDERMHIGAATRAAAKYLKTSNEQFRNWLYALLSYNEGRSGVQKFIKQQYIGAKAIPIASNAHIYIIHFIAFKTVFEPVIGKAPHPELYLYEYNEGHGKNLREISREFGVDRTKLKAYNKWLKSASIPYDTQYATIIPLTHQQYAQYSRRRKFVGTTKKQLPKAQLDYKKYLGKAETFPLVTLKKEAKTGIEYTAINGIPGVQAQQEDSLASLAKAGNITINQFLAYNDIDENHIVTDGQVYYYKPKRSKASIHFHIAKEEETWWSIAQKYGIRKRDLFRKNRLRKEVALEPGRVLWLRFVRPSHIPVAYERLQAAEE